jgi:hypothetical protein
MPCFDPTRNNLFLLWGTPKSEAFNTSYEQVYPIFSKSFTISVKNSPDSISMIPVTFSKTTQSGFQRCKTLMNSLYNQFSVLSRLFVRLLDVEKP